MNHSIALVFPGQGKLPDALPPQSEFGDRLFAHARERGLPLRQWITEGDAAVLRRTENAQPALLIDSLIRERTLRQAGWSPALVAGHSLGEYAALVSAGVISALDALGAVIERGRAMSGVDGAMAAILNLEIDAVEALCREIGSGVGVANHNGPTQIVVSGDRAGVDRLCRRAKALSGRCIPLDVSGPFHSPLMAPAERALEPLLRHLPFAPPEPPVVSGVTAAVHRDAEELREALCRQITARVRWLEVVARLEQSGVEAAVEVGATDVLTRLGRRMKTAIRFITYEEAMNERV